MSRMFDNLRRAEQARKKKNGGRNDDTRQTDLGEGEAPAATDTQVSTAREMPSSNGTGELPDGFVRELGILHNSIEAALSSMPRRVIMFTSASHEEGVTTLASSYARLLGRGDRERVLLVELNARRPALFWRLGLSVDTGVSHYFTENRPLSSVIQRDTRFGFDVVHIGEKDPATIQLHMEEALPRLLAEAKVAYGTVIVDAPPVIMSPETPRLARRMDGVVMVVHCGKTRREIVRRSITMIEQFDGTVLGIALNRKKYYIPEFLYQRV